MEESTINDVSENAFQNTLPSAKDNRITSQQAMSQQMVLCPVRLVYETQILVQPGDQIQPNQTFFINPQNPPPWMQNSLQHQQQQQQQVSNPVVYVQQLQNNMVQPVQQQIDQNQLYLPQNFANFQIPQQMLAQNHQEIRPAMQIANIMPNIVQNNTSNDRTVTQNQNTQIIQNQIINRPIQNQMVNQTVEPQRQVFMRPQIHQQSNIQRPVMAMNQMQNMGQQTMVNMANIGSPNVNQTFIPNMIRQAPNTIRTPTAINAPRQRTAAPTETIKTVNTPIGNILPNAKTFVPNYYRPIQPRPQIINQVPNIPKMPQHIPVQTLQNTLYNHENNKNIALIQHLNNPAINRKRKSESPDDMQKKMVVNNVKPNYPLQQNVTVTKIVNEIGTNTSPVHRPKLNTRVEINQTIIKPEEKINKDITIKVNTREITQTVIKPEEKVKEISKDISEKDKLIRNTVYPQARGRVLQDKIDEIKPQIEAVSNEQAKIIENKIIKPELETNSEINLESKVPEIVQTNISAKVEKTEENITEKVNEQENIVIEKVEAMEINKIETSEINKDVVMEINKIETIENKVDDMEVNNVETVEIKKELPVSSIDTEKAERELEESCMKSNHSQFKIKQENINILTHVVDGYVIQESNFAFPIRKPLKEKCLKSNLKSKRRQTDKDSVREIIKEELKTNADVPLLPFHYLMLDGGNNEEKKEAENKDEVEDSEKDHPFSSLQHSTVKSWTVEDLCNHLLKFNWKETVSLLQDHEIDGETLYLVSKPQLLTIGVSEDHADVICLFVKS